MESWLGDVHWGLVIGIVLCVLCGAWLSFSASGFAMRVVGGNARARGSWACRRIGSSCWPACWAAAAGLAGAIEVAAVHNAANASVIAGLATRASWSASWRGTSPGRFRRWPSSLVALRRRAACCSGGWGCRMPRCWCCRALPSSSSWPPGRCAGALQPAGHVAGACGDAGHAAAQGGGRGLPSTTSRT